MPGRVHDGDTGEVACDHYHRMAEDLDLMAALGLPSYRFSVSWPRVIPGGSGPVNEAGLDFYRRLVDGLLERNITPLLTLYHWDLPQALQFEGGWANRDTVERFTDYAEVIGRALGDRVPTITTLNEPWCSAFLGHSSGVHAPGLTDNATALAVAHHLNLAHGRAVSVLRSVSPAQLSITLNLAQVQPASERPEDLAAAEHVDDLANRIFTEPILRGSYPDRLLRETSHLTDWSFVADGDLAEINAAIDVLGVNFYAPSRVAAATEEVRAQVTGRWVNDPSSSESGPSPWPGTDRAYSIPQPGPYTAMGWPIVPDALTELLLRVHRDYPEIPLIVTENGAAFDDAADRGPGARPRPDRLRAPAPGRRARRHRGRCRRPGVLPVVADGQLRVGLGVLQALRHGARRLRQPAAHPEGLGAVVPRRHQEQRGRAALTQPAPVPDRAAQRCDLSFSPMLKSGKSASTAMLLPASPLAFRLDSVCNYDQDRRISSELLKGA